MDRFTKEQIREFNDAFSMFDTKDLGYIEASEIREMLKTIGYNPTDDNLEKLTIIVDEDNNSKIEFHEFINIIASLESDEKHQKEAEDAFNAFDYMGKGFIPSEDISAAIMFIMEKMTQAEKDAVVHHFKLKPNRKVYFAEFKEMLTIRP